MSDAIDARPFPASILLAAGCLITATIGLAGLASWKDIGATRLDPGPPVASHELRFSEQANGVITAYDAAGGHTIAVIPPKGNGFVGVVLKRFARDRSLAGLAADLPFRLNTYADGSSMLEDTSSGRAVTLGAFGADNLKAFTQLTPKGRSPQ
ncbi:MAG: photosynthetic complex assembly protein PuhC [Hyphomicrobium sp.]